MRFRLRTLLIVLAVGPPVLAALWSVSSLPLALLYWVALFALAVFIVAKFNARQRSHFSDD